MRYWTVIVLSFVTAAAQAANPPLPDLEHPVNYLQWINEQYRAGINDNAADVYLEAVELMAPGADIVAVMEIIRRPVRHWSSDDRKKVTDWITSNERALEKCALAAKIKKSYFEAKSDTGRFLDVIWPLASMRELVLCAEARVKLRLFEKDVEGAMSDLELILSTARHLESQPAVISFLVGVSARTRAYDLLKEVPTLDWADAPYNDLRKQLRKIDTEPGSMKTALVGERAFFYDLIQHCAVDADGDGKIEALDLSKLSPDMSRANINPPRGVNELVEIYEDWIKLLETATAATYPEAKRLQTDAREVSEKLGLSELMGTSLFRTDELARMSLAQRNATRAVLLLHAYKAIQGKWPETLREAMNVESSRYRSDPFSEGELIYRLKDGQPLLYSIGPDGKDDGGRPREKGDFSNPGDLIYWPPGND